MTDTKNKGILDRIRESGFCLDRLAEYYPELGILKGVKQNPEYHAEGDVYVHTGMVCGELLKLPEWDGLPKREQEMLFLAAAFHDIGKPACTKFEDGRWTSPKHTVVGEKVFRAMAYRGADRFGMDFWERELAAKLVRFHGLPVWFWKKNRTEHGLLRAAEVVPLRLLYLLAKADARGRMSQTPGELEGHGDLFADYAKELGVWENAYPFVNAYTRYQYFHKEGLQPGAQLYDDTEFDVWMMSGLPLAGKDTWIKENYGGRPVISLDDIREELGISPKDGSGKVASLAKERSKKLLRKKEPFIWNATNLMQETRQRLIRLFAGYGARVHLVYLEAGYGELLERNQIRKRQIPGKVLEQMIDKTEMPEPWEGYEVRYHMT
ncbi:MAG: AAA family ATPase [Lachnospiraceae bacterium]|nr:AAA family ATPase [Lachnospiraceae bacterium]